MSRFGKVRLDDFLLSDQYTFVNHGSYGAVARPVNQARDRLLAEFESNPDRFYRRKMWDYYEENIQSAAKFLGADPENIVFATNTTSGINTVLKSVRFQPGDKILVTSWTYMPIRKTVEAVCDVTGAVMVEVEIRLRNIKTSSDLVKMHEDVIKANPEIKLAIIDMISSVPCTTLPYPELMSLCRDHGIMSILDGAHTPGQIPINLEQLAPDFYIANLHKWCYTHRGLAVMYVHPKHHSTVVPLVTSVHYHQQDLRRRFYYQGTDDVSKYNVVKEAIKYYTDLGGVESVAGYNSALVTEAAAMLAERWRTAQLAIPDEMLAPCMMMVRLPSIKRFPVVQEEPGNIETLFGDLPDLMFELMDRFHIVVLVLYLENQPYVRISANIYNCMDDYHKLAGAILTLQSEDSK